MPGSGLFSKKQGLLPHLLASHGISAEVNDLRTDVAKEFGPLAGIAVEEYLNLAASNTAGLLVATASTVAIQTQSAFLAGALGVGALAAAPRSIKFTTAGGTAADAPATVLVTGRDVNGAVQTETLALAQTATSVETIKCFSSLTSVVYAAGDGAGATIAIGIGTKVGFAKKLKSRAGGFFGLTREIINTLILKEGGGLTVDEFTDAAAPDAAGLLIATASTVAVQTYLTAALLAGGKAALLAFPRNVTFTTAGGTAADAPATATITGTDINDCPLTEVVNIAQTATIANGVKAFKTITSIVYSAGDGAGATVSIGFGSVFGLSRPLRFRAGLQKAVQEIAIGAVVTTGTFALPAASPPNGTYAPAAAPNGTNDYAVYYEAAQSTVVSAAVSAPNGSYAPVLPFDGTLDIAIFYEYDGAA